MYTSCSKLCSTSRLQIHFNIETVLFFISEINWILCRLCLGKMLEFDSLLGPIVPSRDVGTDVVLSREITDMISSIKCLNTTLELLKGFF